MPAKVPGRFLALDGTGKAIVDKSNGFFEMIGRLLPVMGITTQAGYVLI